VSIRLNRSAYVASYGRPTDMTILSTPAPDCKPIDPFDDLEDWLRATYADHISSHLGEDIEREHEAVERLRMAIASIQDDLSWYWHWGDGRGGFVLNLLAAAVREEGYKWPLDGDEKKPFRKASISRRLSKEVMERDEYRCVVCKTHLDLSCDHIVPESKGGPTSIENLQTMCRPCNSRKGNRA